MKDQPFKRHFASDRGTQGQSYKYPSYKHYYQTKKSKLGEPNQKLQENKNQQNKAALLDGDKDPDILIGKSNKTSLKKQLQNLKFQVHKIMQQKQKFQRISVQKKTSPQFGTHKAQKYQSQSNQAQSQQILGSQSVENEELQIQTKITNQSYVAKHTETQNNLLTIQLKNLKNRYINKKKELKEKCNQLQKRVVFLQGSLEKSQESLNNQIASLKLQLQQTKSSKLSSDTQNNESKQNQKLEQLYKKLNISLNRIFQLEEEINKLQKNGSSIQKKQLGKNNSIQIQSKFDLTKKEYEYKLQVAKSQINQLKCEILNINNTKTLLEEQIKYMHSQKQLNQQKIEQLNNQIKLEKTNCQNIQEIYKANIQAKQKQYQQLLKNIQTQYKKRSKPISNQKIQGSQEKVKNISTRDVISEESILQKQVEKWKIQYKLLKERYQSHVSRENKNKKEFQEYYSTYRQSKNKMEIYTHKINILEKQLENYMNLLTGKQNELIKKQIEIRRISNEQTFQQNKYTHEIQALTDRYKQVEEKYNEQIQKHQKQVTYRKQIQEKILSFSDIDDSSLKEVIDRIKKRLIQQDQKMSKNVKQLKSKDTLNTKLKQQLRQTIQNLQQKINFQKNEQIKQIIEDYTQKQTLALSNWKQKTQKQIKVLQQNNNKLISQILTLKNSLNQKDKQLISTQNELKTIKSSYNIKGLQNNDALQQKQLVIQQYIQQLYEAEILKKHVQNVLQEQIQRKNQQINSLREDLLLKITKNQTYTKHNPSFDDILKSHMETSTKLRDDVNKKTEEIFRLRDNYSTLRSQYQNLKSQIDINKLKMLSQKKNIEVNYQIQIQNLQNEIAGQQKKMASLQQKIKVVIQQNKKKDTFIQTYIMGKKLPQNQKELVSAFINKYQITLGSADVVQRLQFDTKQLQKLSIYNNNLLKQVSLLKEKLLLFEGIDQQKLSLYQSELQKGSQTNIKEQKFEQIDLHKKPHVKKTQSLHIPSISQIKHQENQ